MREKNKLQIMATGAYALVSALFLLFAVYMGLMEHNQLYQARSLEPCEIVENYTESSLEDPSAPLGLRKEYRWELSDVTLTKDYLGFYMVYNYAQVSIGGEVLYHLSPSEENHIGALPGSNWVFIPLDQSDSGQEVVVTLTPAHKSALNREIEFLIGSRSDMVLRRLRTDLPQITVSVLCIVLSATLMFLQPLLFRRKGLPSWELFYLGNFLLLIGLWRITDTRSSPILFPGNTMALGYISLAALFLVAAPLLLFIQDQFTGRKKTLLLLMQLAVCCSALAMLLCQLFQLAELRDLLTVCHLLLILSMVVLLLVSLVHREQEPVRKDLRGLALILSAGCIADLLYFYWKKTSSGVIFSIIALLIYTAARFVSEISTMNKKGSIDAQTGLYNRSRWNDMLESPSFHWGDCAVMMLDLNGLKHVNDTMGHKMGDKMILDFAKFLQEVFSGDCKVFRWGGDEFTVWIPSANREKMEDYGLKLSQAVKAYNDSGEKPEIHYALGYALSQEYPDLSCDELLKKADEKMYLNKNQWYQQNVPQGRWR